MISLKYMPTMYNPFKIVFQIIGVEEYLCSSEGNV